MTPRRWVVLAAILLAAALPFIHAVRDAEYATHDLRFRFQPPPKNDANVCVVAIDRAAVRIWKEPRALWSGRVARLIDVLNGAGVKTIGLDTSFPTDSDEFLHDRFTHFGVSEEALAGYEFPNGLLRIALFGSKAPVWLATQTKGRDWSKECLPDRAPNLPHGKANLASANTNYVNLDTIRHLEPFDDGMPTLAFACAGQQFGVSSPYWINYQGPEVAVKSAEYLLSGPNDLSFLKGAVVIIGDTFDLGNDVQNTPYPPTEPRGSGRRNGVQIQAEAVRTLLNKSQLTVPTENWVAMVSAVVAGLFGLLAMSWPGLKYLLASLGVAVAYSFASLIALDRWHWMLPLAAPLIVIFLLVPLLAYPVREVQRRIEVERAEAEGARIRSRWGQMIDDRLVQFIEKRRDAGLGALGTFDAAFLYLDVADFSAKSNNLTDVEMLDNVNRMFEAFVPIIQGEKGIVITFTGDGLTSGFDAVEGTEEQRGRALKTALAILAELDSLNAKDTFIGGEWRIRIGLGSGPVTLALVGSEKRQTMAYYGEAVNMASRLEQGGKELGVSLVMSEAYVGVAAELGVAVEERSIQLKGWKQPLRVWVLAPK